MHWDRRCPVLVARRVRVGRLALGKDDFMRVARGEPLVVPPEHFRPPASRGPEWPDYPDLREAVDWFKSFMTPEDWRSRRDAAFSRLYQSAFGLAPAERKGRFFDESDMFGWYLFLADAFLDHVWNYEPTFGSRIIPAFAAVGRNLALLKRMNGVEGRVRRIVGPERSQPNGGVFELLAAAAYGRRGAGVSFRTEEPGRAKSWDIDVELEGRRYAVECKRMEVSEYGERERAQMRELWRPACELVVKAEVSAFCNVDFCVPVFDVTAGYLAEKAREWLASGLPSLLWKDGISEGVIGEMDLTPLKEVLRNDDVLAAGTRLHQLLTGRYIRHANYVQLLRYKFGISPRYIGECDRAILLRWQSSAAASISAKARDVVRKLAEATRQLPPDTDSIVHIGFEAVEGDAVERARFEKVLASTAAFDPEGKPLRYVYCHYFVPESPPDKAWAFDETVQWRRISGNLPRPLERPFLVLPDTDGMREGPHWESCISGS